MTDREDYIEAQKDGAYSERDSVVAALARLCLSLEFRVWMGHHSAEDPSWDNDWRNIVFIELPTGQVSWHLHDSELPLFAGIPIDATPWDGHNTREKYDRLDRWNPQHHGGQLKRSDPEVERQIMAAINEHCALCITCRNWDLTGIPPCATVRKIIQEVRAAPDRGRIE